MLVQSDEQRAEDLLKLAEKDVQSHWNYYKQMAAMNYGNGND